MNWTWDELKRRSEDASGGIIGARIRVNDKANGVYQGTITRIEEIGPDEFKVRTENVRRQRPREKGESPTTPPDWVEGGQMPCEQFKKSKILGASRPQIDYPGGFATIFPVGDGHH